MKNMIISLGILLYFLILPLYGQENNDFIIQGNVLIKYTGKAEHVIIPANLGITEIGEKAFAGETPFGIVSVYYSNNDILETVIIPEGVTTIGDKAFYNCNKLTSVSMPESVIIIGNEAFYSCDNLGDIMLPANVTFIGNNAFIFCNSLANINIPASVTSIGEGAFASCRSLKSITVDLNNKVFCSREGILFNKDEKVLIQYPAGKTEQTYIMPETVITICDEAFANTKLESITISPNVTSIGKRAFFGSFLASVTIPVGLTIIEEYAFAFCIRLTSISIPEGVTAIGYMAFWSSNLTGITIPASVIFIGDRVFIGEEGYYGYGHRSILASITVDERNLVYSSIDGVLFNKDKTVLMQYPAGRNESTYIIPSSVTTIGNQAFFGSHNLEYITIPSRVVSIGEMAFWQCSKLKIVELSRNAIASNSLDKIFNYTGIRFIYSEDP